MFKIRSNLCITRVLGLDFASTNYLELFYHKRKLELFPNERVTSFAWGFTYFELRKCQIRIM